MNNQSIQTIIDLFVQGNQHIWLTDTRGGSGRGQRASEEALCQRRPHCRHTRYTMLRASHHLLICDGCFYVWEHIPPCLLGCTVGRTGNHILGVSDGNRKEEKPDRQKESSTFIKRRQKHQRRAIWQHDRKLEKTVGTYTGAGMGTGNMWSCGCRQSGVLWGSVTGMSITVAHFSFTCSLIPFILNCFFSLWFDSALKLNEVFFMKVWIKINSTTGTLHFEKRKAGSSSSHAMTWSFPDSWRPHDTVTVGNIFHCMVSAVLSDLPDIKFWTKSWLMEIHSCLISAPRW